MIVHKLSIEPGPAWVDTSLKHLFDVRDVAGNPHEPRSYVTRWFSVYLAARAGLNGEPLYTVRYGKNPDNAVRELSMSVIEAMADSGSGADVETGRSRAARWDFIRHHIQQMEVT